MFWTLLEWDLFLTFDLLPSPLKNLQIPIPRDLTDRASGDIEKSSDENSDEEKPDLKENGDQHCPATEPILDDQKVQSKSGEILL